ncbi:hypothetical protein CRG98_034672 [Punica granatum]|uniref:Uncharacterized protein n=1 Tax=Punica granatum TaxID=22663 RepID=A0A2I0ILP9_PUNGR|nr:hypothetical protein CRG98_034672 [Punica granatum]
MNSAKTHGYRELALAPEPSRAREPHSGFTLGCEPNPGVARPQSRRTQAWVLGFVERETISLSTNPGFFSLRAQASRARVRRDLGLVNPTTGLASPGWLRRSDLGLASHGFVR